MINQNLIKLGYTQALEKSRTKSNIKHYGVARVLAEHKERYVINNGSNEYTAEIIGNMRYSAESRADFPAVGDWVEFMPMDNDSAIIYSILPRKSLLQRQQVGSSTDRQMIASNVDVALIVQSANRDFSLNRLERYLAICYDSNIDPVVILNKIDLQSADEVNSLNESINQRVGDVPIFMTSTLIGQGIDSLFNSIDTEKTYCLLGSSGVGKSTLFNLLMGKVVMQTGDISETANRGKHVTTHRELRVMPSGGVLIDNPGMREIGLTESNGGIDNAFSEITNLAKQCKYKDCQHSELSKHCAVQQALLDNTLSQDVFNNYLKMQREQERFEMTTAEQRKKFKSFTKESKRAIKGKSHKVNQ